MGRLCCTRYEREARQRGWTRIAGLDEVGRGSLFGPVFAAAVILNPRRRIVGLDDSKKLSSDRRAILSERIREHALAWAVAEVDAPRIDAMHLDVLIEQRALIKGDARSVSIAAASIIAKVARDARLEELDKLYPQYGLARNKGYGTADHLEALRRHGATPLHRFSFAPVREAGCWAAGATQTPLPLDAAPS